MIHHERSSSSNKKVRLTARVFFYLFIAFFVLIVISSSLKNQNPNQSSNYPSITISNNDQNKSNDERNSSANNNKLVLSLNPQEKQLKNNEEFTVYVEANSGTRVLGIDLYLAYDPKSFKLVNVSPGDFFVEPMTFSKSIDTKLGKIFYGLGSVKNSKTDGAILKLTFKAIQNGANSQDQKFLVIDSKTLASVNGATKADIIIKGPGIYGF